MAKPANKMDIAKKKVITPIFRVSFPQVFTPKQFGDQKPKYSLTMLFDKKTDIKTIKQAAFNAALEQFGSKERFPKNMKWPWRDGDQKEDVAGYAGHIFISASAKESSQPGLVDKDRQPILNERDFYAGCYARAELIAFYYDQQGNKGVSFSLQNIQKWKDGEAFSGRKNAEDVFDDLEDDSDDESNYADDDMGF